MPLAAWIMRAATENPPKGREQWAEAMRAEYASLENGKLGWALGCWSAMLGWRLRADAIYLAVMLTVATVWAFDVFTQNIMVFYLRHAPDAFTRSEIIQPYLALMLLVSIALCTFRPDRVVTTGLAMLVLLQCSDVAGTAQFQRDFPNVDPGPMHPYNSPYFVAIFAEIGVCFAGALIGRAIAGLWRKKQPPQLA